MRDAIDMFAKMPKESITNHAKYLYSMCKNAAQGKAPIPNDKIVEEVGQLECERQNKISHMRATVLASQLSIISGHKYPQNA